MGKVSPYPIIFENDEVIYVKEDGVKWLYENYFKRDYLKELEEYKWELKVKKIIKILIFIVVYKTV